MGRVGCSCYRPGDGLFTGKRQDALLPSDSNVAQNIRRPLVKLEHYSQDDADLVARARQTLDRSVEELDHATVLRLQRVRNAALSAGSSPPWKWAWRGGLALATIAALAVLLWTKQPAQDQHHAPLLEDMELVISAENVELAEDLEFY